MPKQVAANVGLVKKTRSDVFDFQLERLVDTTEIDKKNWFLWTESCG